MTLPRKLSTARRLTREAFQSGSYVRLERLSSEARAEMTPEEIASILETGIRRALKEAMDREPRVVLHGLKNSCPAYLAIPFGISSEYVYISAEDATYSDMRLWYKSQEKKISARTSVFKSNQRFYDEVTETRPTGSSDHVAVSTALVVA